MRWSGMRSAALRPRRRVWRVAPRTVWNKIARRRYVANGVSLIAQLRHGLAMRGIPLWLDTELVEILEHDGRVSGVRVRHRGTTVDVIAAARGGDNSWWVVRKGTPQRPENVNTQPTSPPGMTHRNHVFG